MSDEGPVYVEGRLPGLGEYSTSSKVSYAVRIESVSADGQDLVNEYYVGTLEAARRVARQQFSRAMVKSVHIMKKSVSILRQCVHEDLKKDFVAPEPDRGTEVDTYF